MCCLELVGFLFVPVFLAVVVVGRSRIGRLPFVRRINARRLRGGRGAMFMKKYSAKPPLLTHIG